MPENDWLEMLLIHHKTYELSIKTLNDEISKIREEELKYHDELISKYAKFAIGQKILYKEFDEPATIGFINDRTIVLDTKYQTGFHKHNGFIGIYYKINKVKKDGTASKLCYHWGDFVPENTIKGTEEV